MRKLIFVLLAALAATAQAQTIYRWVDANGRVQYSSDKPPTTVAQVQKPQVKMFATDWCPYCRQAREYFTRNGIPFTELDVEKNAAANAEYRSLGGRGVPLILVGDKRMNGFTEARMAQLLKDAGY